MAAKKKASKPKKAAKKTATKKAAKKKTEKKASGPSRKSFILELVQKAGKKGVSTDKLIEQTAKKFEYPADKPPRMRVNNTLKEAAADGQLTVKDGVAIWKK